jgi:hypothetical protein
MSHGSFFFAGGLASHFLILLVVSIASLRLSCLHFLNTCVDSLFYFLGGSALARGIISSSVRRCG